MSQNGNNEITSGSPDTIDVGKEGWKAYITHRTKAMPKNSLFGTVLENADKQAAAAIDAKMYEQESIAQRHQQASQYEYKLPAGLQQTAAKDELMAKQNDLKSKQDKLGERQLAVMDMENQAKYYAAVPSSLHQGRQMKKKMLLADPGLDLELTRKMNDVGYAERNNYNKDKHRKRPPVHRYAVIGDPLEYGMDFSLHQTETHEKYSGQTPTVANRFYRSLRQHKSAPVAAPEKGTIPANIKARYGSKIVEELFADEQAVGRVKQQMEQEMIRRQMRHKKVELPPVEIVTPKNYGDLSHALRQDKFGGHSYLNASLMKDSHTQEVFDRRYRDPDEFRHTWDEYGKWKEQELCREKMDRDYEEFIQTLPKLAANWDRNARPIKKEELTQIPKRPKKDKTRKKQAQKQPGKANEPAFEDVVFVTPPITPEMQSESIMPSDNKNKRDDDFWNMYDQGLPPIK